MNELAKTVREALAVLAAADPNLRRFGAARHRYQLAPPLAAPPPDCPEALADVVTSLGSGGAGPYHGWIAIEGALRHPVLHATYGRAIPIAHLGCGYAAVMPVDTGAIWLDARAAGIVKPIAEGFVAFYLDWIARGLHNAFPEAYVPADACALPSALTGYLAAWEQRHDLAPGSLAGAGLATALAELGPGAIEIAAGPPLFDHRERADPCVACARLIENLGLAAGVVVPGTPPIAERK